MSLESGRDHLEVHLLSSGCSRAPSGWQTLMGTEPPAKCRLPFLLLQDTPPPPHPAHPPGGCRAEEELGPGTPEVVTLFPLCGFSP